MYLFKETWKMGFDEMFSMTSTIYLNIFGGILKWLNKYMVKWSFVYICKWCNGGTLQLQWINGDMVKPQENTLFIKNRMY